MSSSDEGGALPTTPLAPPLLLVVEEAGPREGRGEALGEAGREEGAEETPLTPLPELGARLVLVPTPEAEEDEEEFEGAPLGRT